MQHNIIPQKTGLYDPVNEYDACGVGFVTYVDGRHSHQIVLDALTMLRNMDHRGACGCESNAGDGAGILTGIPHDFMRKVVHDLSLGIDLPTLGRYGVGNVFLPGCPTARTYCKQQLEYFIAAQGQTLLGWRHVPTDADHANIGIAARQTEPVIEQVFIGAAVDLDEPVFRRKLYLLRKQTYHKITSERPDLLHQYYVCSLDNRVITYKGQLTSGQVPLYYPDLLDNDYSSHLAMVHSRFSTNTFPSWDRAQPMRFMAHNGEINTLRGNINWMRARETLISSEVFGEDLKKLLPIIDQTTSDSGVMDNVLELLMLSGRTLPEVIMMLIPEAWQGRLMSAEKKAFYDYHACLMEPWDGPALVTFTDGHYIGAVLDRNGLRPGRFYIMQDNRVILASEAGVLPSIDPADIKIKGRLQPGYIFLVDTLKQKLIPDEVLKHDIASRRPYAKWLECQRFTLSDLNYDQQSVCRLDAATLLPRMKAFGYTVETLQFFLRPMIVQKRDPLGSMGNDAALAVLSEQPRLLYDYFKQLFAQVTNPPIDSIREAAIMSLGVYIGPEVNLLGTTERHAHRLYLPEPVISNEQLTALQHIEYNQPDSGWKACVIDITWVRNEPGAGLLTTLDRICDESEKAITAGFSLIILSDRKIDGNRIACSALLAIGAVHQHLIRQGKRTQIGIVVETGEAREVHHHCLLLGYGADAINPYLAFEALWQDRRDDRLPQAIDTDEKIVSAYCKAVCKGILKVMAKMGISTLASYKGAQIFEAIGLNADVMVRCFNGTVSHIQGMDFALLEKEMLLRHENAYFSRYTRDTALLVNDGQLHWRTAGEKHAHNPATITLLQTAARSNSSEAYEQFASLVDTDNRNRCSLRGLFNLRKDSAPLFH